jgi:hypothetical protein
MAKRKQRCLTAFLLESWINIKKTDARLSDRPGVVLDTVLSPVPTGGDFT